jgi:hypothetical protein
MAFLIKDYEAKINQLGTLSQVLTTSLMQRQALKRHLNLRNYQTCLKRAKQSNTWAGRMSHDYVLGCVFSKVSAALYLLKLTIEPIEIAGSIASPVCNIVDVIGIAVDALKEYEHRNRFWAFLNSLSSIQLLTGTGITSAEVFSNLIEGLSIGVGLNPIFLACAPASFAICMSFNVLAAARKAYQLHDHIHFLKDKIKNQSISTLSIAPDDLDHFEAIFEMIKEIRINRELALEQEENEDEAIGKLTIKQIIEILHAEKHIQKFSVLCWIVHIIAMTVLTLFMLAVLTETTPPLLVLGCLAIVLVFCSVVLKGVFMKADTIATQNIVASTDSDKAYPKLSACHHLWQKISDVVLNTNPSPVMHPLFHKGMSN